MKLGEIDTRLARNPTQCGAQAGSLFVLVEMLSNSVPSSILHTFCGTPSPHTRMSAAWNSSPVTYPARDKTLAPPPSLPTRHTYPPSTPHTPCTKSQHRALLSFTPPSSKHTLRKIAAPHPPSLVHPQTLRCPQSRMWNI